MQKAEAVVQVLRGCRGVAVAVSGGVDSLTLASLAHRYAGIDVAMYHAVSAAVPIEATTRVQALARDESWNLTVFDAGEFADERYRANPVDRCFFCKGNLYDSIASLSAAQIVSGTNVDDLGDYRPGLQAAAARGVRHPYVEAGVDKAAVRAIAASLGLPEIAQIPASPCLSSRIETGITIEPTLLLFVHGVEQLLDQRFSVHAARCRVRNSGIVIEIDAPSLARISPSEREDVRRKVQAMLREAEVVADVRFEPYRTGSAFLRSEASS